MEELVWVEAWSWRVGPFQFLVAVLRAWVKQKEEGD